MKLYTKEDFLKAAEFCEVSMIDARYIIERIDEVTDPIEIPSDEEIEKSVTYSNLKSQYDFSTIIGFKKGARWVIDKIQGGNK